MSLDDVVAGGINKAKKAFTRGWGMTFEPSQGRRTLDHVLSKIEQAGLDGICLVDFGKKDFRYEVILH